MAKGKQLARAGARPYSYRREQVALRQPELASGEPEPEGPEPGREWHELPYRRRVAPGGNAPRPSPAEQRTSAKLARWWPRVAPRARLLYNNTPRTFYWILVAARLPVPNNLGHT